MSAFLLIINKKNALQFLNRRAFVLIGAKRQTRTAEHPPFQGGALPTELSWHIYILNTILGIHRMSRLF